MHICNVLCEPLIIIPVRFIQNQEHNIESGQEGSGQVDVFYWRSLGIVPSIQGISCGEDGSACIKGGGDTSLGDGDGLLFHDFVDSCSVRFLHLIEFIDTADTIVG